MKIDICIPNYNYGEFIGKTIESILALNDDNIGIIVYDDYSSDNSVQLLKDKYPMVKLIESEKNTGPGIGRKIMAQESGADYIFYLDSDDTICEIGFNKLLKELSGNDVVIGYTQGEINNQFRSNKSMINNMKNKNNFDYIGFSPTMCGMFLKKDFINENEIYASNYRAYEDNLFAIRLLKSKPIFKVINEKVINVNVHAASMTAQYTSEKVDILINSSIDIHNEIRALSLKSKLFLDWNLFVVGYNNVSEEFFQQFMDAKKHIRLASRSLIVLKGLVKYKNLAFLKII